MELSSSESQEKKEEKPKNSDTVHIAHEFHPDVMEAVAASIIQEKREQQQIDEDVSNHIQDTEQKKQDEKTVSETDIRLICFIGTPSI